VRGPKERQHRSQACSPDLRSEKFASKREVSKQQVVWIRIACLTNGE
jgi:hypothetical protein